MLETKNKMINGREFQVTQFPGRYGLRLQARLARVFGAPLAALFKGAKKGMDSDLADLDLEKAVVMLMDKLSEDELDDLVNRMLSQTRVDGKGIIDNPMVFDELFAANYSDLFKVLAFVVEVNFGNFFSALKGIGSPAKPEKQKG